MVGPQPDLNSRRGGGEKEDEEEESVEEEEEDGGLGILLVGFEYYILPLYTGIPRAKGLFQQIGPSFGG